MPAWQGESLEGKTLLIWCEQGLGEAILSLSYIKDLALEADRIILECDPRLVDLVQRSLPTITVIPEQDKTHREIAKAKPTLQVPIFEVIGYCYKANPKTEFPSSYLLADSTQAGALREKYLEIGGNRPLVGISWGSPQAATAREKSLHPEYWKAILGLSSVTFVNLQYGAMRPDMVQLAAQCGATLIDDSDIDPSGPLASLADQIAAVDLVITVSNTTAHLAGALGQEAWVLVPPLGPGSMWYWFSDGEDSPWYSSAKIFRRQVHADEPFMTDVSRKLKDWIVRRS